MMLNLRFIEDPLNIIIFVADSEFTARFDGCDFFVDKTATRQRQQHSIIYIR